MRLSSWSSAAIATRMALLVGGTAGHLEIYSFTSFRSSFADNGEVDFDSMLDILLFVLLVGWLVG